MLTPESDLGPEAPAVGTPLPGLGLTLDGECSDVTGADVAAVRALPGSYAARLRSPLGVLVSESFTLTVPAERVHRPWRYVSPEVVTALQEQVREWATTCIAAGLVGPECPPPELSLLDQIEVTEVGLLRLGRPAVGDGAGGRDAEMFVTVEVSGTRRCPEGSPDWCVPGEQVDTTLDLLYLARITADTSGELRVERSPR